MRGGGLGSFMHMFCFVKVIFIFELFTKWWYLTPSKIYQAWRSTAKQVSYGNIYVTDNVDNWFFYRITDYYIEWPHVLVIL